jgi:hypothetical protein
MAPPSRRAPSQPGRVLHTALLIKSIHGTSRLDQPGTRIELRTSKTLRNLGAQRPLSRRRPLIGRHRKNRKWPAHLSPDRRLRARTRANVRATDRALHNRSVSPPFSDASGNRASTIVVASTTCRSHRTLNEPHGVSPSLARGSFRRGKPQPRPGAVLTGVGQVDRWLGR